MITTLADTFTHIPRLDLARVNADLRHRSPLEILEWVVLTFGSRVALQSSMQKTAGVLMHLVSQLAPKMEIIFVDTGVHFPETLDLRDEYARRYGLNIQTFHPTATFDKQFAEYGRYLHETDDSGSAPTLQGYRFCCKLRKEEPFIGAVKGRFHAVIGGLMREEGGARANIEIVNWDDRVEAYKIYPLAYATAEQVDDYTNLHNLPVHPLYAKSFTSIGCYTCTTPVAPGEDKRAGRWRHIREAKGEVAGAPIYCGINLEDVKK